ncbi:DNA repair protein RAD51 -like protein 3 [Echinococcus granulosus]|nr:DNA repair protein RAD51 -like protein 3 [Echinococcus granulosus]
MSHCCRLPFARILSLLILSFAKAYLSMLSDPDFRELVMLPLPTSVLRELSRAGYSNVGEISGLTIEQIESVCKIPKPRAASIATIIQEHASLRKDSVFTTNFPNKNLFYPRSALQMLHPSLSNLVNPSEFRVANVLTMSKSFDDLMGGGFPCGRITELCGQPGVGKTQFCLQTCLTVQIPQWCGGLAGEAIFLDTEGSFIPKRLHQMAVELVKHCQTMLAPCLQQYMEGLDDSYADAEEKVACLEALSRIPTEESLLSKVHYIRCTGYLQLLAAVQRLGEFCKYHPNIRLIIVDSIALPFRYEFEDIPQRNRLLAAVAQSLLSTASAQNAAVIMTNQITTKFVTSETSATTRSTLVPALGESWGHICSVRLLLSKAEGSDAEQRRTARLLKHPGRPPGTAAYQVTAGGIRDCF